MSKNDCEEDSYIYQTIFRGGRPSQPPVPGDLVIEHGHEFLSFFPLVVYDSILDCKCVVFGRFSFLAWEGSLKGSTCTEQLPSQ